MSEKLHHHDAETRKHILEVNKNIQKLSIELLQRGVIHDASKLESPEREIYSESTGQLKDVKYGTPEYTELVKSVWPAVEHHYSKNRHHPEHWDNGLEDMDLVDILELLCDWMAATKRNKDGDIHKSISLNTPRYHISPQLVKILTNTIDRYFSYPILNNV